MYGVTETGGTGLAGVVYSVPLSSGQETVAYNFTGANNEESDGGFTRVKSALFAAVAQGGASSQGEVLCVAPSSGAVTNSYSFAGDNGVYPSAAMVSYRGRLYGTTKSGGASGNGEVFSFDPATGAEKVIYSFTGGADGGRPLSGLLNMGGTLYGTTDSGGSALWRAVLHRSENRHGNAAV